LLGIHQLIRCSEEELVDWLPQRNQQVHHNDISVATRLVFSDKIEINVVFGVVYLVEYFHIFRNFIFHVNSILSKNTGRDRGNTKLPHDEDASSQSRKDNYFVPLHFYCVETICAPCGAVLVSSPSVLGHAVGISLGGF
jgi:hypothetical protein